MDASRPPHRRPQHLWPQSPGFSFYRLTGQRGQGRRPMATTSLDARRRQSSSDGQSGSGANRAIPHNLQAEESLLGAMLLSREAIAVAVETLAAQDFYRPIHGHIFDAVTTLYAQGEG